MNIKEIEMINFIVVTIIALISSIVCVFCSAYLQYYILTILSAFGCIANSMTLAECINILREKRNIRGKKE